MRLIDADATIYALNVASRGDSKDVIRNLVICFLLASPTVDAVPVRHGKWIYGNDFHWYTASCNKCGYQRRTDIKADGWNQWMYCPNCGAKMDEERKEE